MRLSATLAICLVSSAAAAGQSKSTVADLGWMSGCWTTDGEEGDSYMSEQWTKPLGMMLGTNRTVREGSVGAYEFLKIEEREGEIYYVARPSGAIDETPFKLTNLTDSTATFENPEHDFPKKLVYSLSADGVLTARVEGDDGGFNLEFRPTSCEER
ncbi:MAG TPA: DUF6265 family protein [Rhodothermales bacterium]|nr:DUF6265 family protein [Rhodothermales bacterium]